MTPKVAKRAYLDTNVLGTLNVLEAVKSLGCPRMVHTSTSESYGSARYTPIDERHPLQAQSPYSATKIAADKLAESYHLSFEVPVATIRPFNTYGPRQSARAVIPTILSQLVRGSDTISLGSLSPERDLTFVADTVEGFLGQEVVWVGTGTHLGRFDEFETVCLDMGAPPLVPFVVYGKFVAANGDELAYYIEGLFNLATQEGTDGGLNFTGGTGRFTNASGWAEAQLIRDAQGNTIASRLPGWISYEASDRSMP